MTQPPSSPSDRTAELVAELDRVMRREAAFRARAVQESLEYRKTIMIQTRELKEVHARAATRDTYIHQLHLEREAERAIFRQAVADLETFSSRLREAEDEAAARQAAIESMRRSWGWKLAAPLRALQARWGAAASAPQPAQPGVPGARFTYFLRTSPYRIYRQPSFTLEGWAFPEDGRAVTAVRVRIDDRAFPGNYGFEEPEVRKHHGAQPNNPHPGLRISFETPPGRHRLSLEARLGDRDWVSFLTTPIWADYADSSG